MYKLKPIIFVNRNSVRLTTDASVIIHEPHYVSSFTEKDKYKIVEITNILTIIYSYEIQTKEPFLDN